MSSIASNASNRPAVRLPPHQQLAAPGKWPIVGERQPPSLREPWQVSVCGLVTRLLTWTLDELRALPQMERSVDIHCVTRWSKPGVKFGGVLLRHLLEPCQPLPEARFISFIAYSERNHSTSLPLADALQLETLVALTCEGKPLEENHGGPVRTVVPGRYFYKSLKWLARMELLAEDRLGYWEAEAGYHNVADPWREQRYLASNLDRREVRELLARRDFSGRDLRGIDAQNQDLAGLNARGALLRDAHLERANLEGACFHGVNLSNGHLEGANLRGASFGSHAGRAADLEGANFRGADLRGADFTGASLFGVTFCPDPGDEEGWGPALLDRTTRLDREAIDMLTPVQQDFMKGLPLRGREDGE
jgi:DMSO/TMAO reductase YedYZ molybdopterin-dependent catalytic subunit